MKIRIIICLVLTFFIITPIIADDVSTTECLKLVSGTWVNNEYRNIGQWGKIVLHENGKRDEYIEASDTKPAAGGDIMMSIFHTYLLNQAIVVLSL